MAQEPVTVFDPTVAAITTTTPSAAVALKKRTDVDSKVKNYKGRIQMAYKKILDKNPAIEADGQVVIRLKIASIQMVRL